MTVEVIRAAALAGMAHGFFGRIGGVSTGAYATLNTGPGSNDDPQSVTENRRRAVQVVLPGAVLLSPYQVHGPRSRPSPSPGPSARAPTRW